MVSVRAALGAFSVLVVVSCGTADAGPGGAGRLVVATTVAPITSITAAVVGNHAEVRGLVPEGINSHTFEPPPSAAETLADADVLFLNGLQLEEPTKELAEATMGDDAVIIELGEATLSEDQYLYDFSFPEDEGRPNPHLWTNPPMAVTYAELIRDQMIELDPGNEEAYRANTEVLRDEVGELDAAMRAAFETVPVEQRKLLTYHDAYAYFAEEYGWEIIGAIQVADFGEPTAGEVADLIDQVRAEELPAIFGSEVFPSPVLEQIGSEAGVSYIDVLRDDDLPGEPGDAEHSLVGLLRSNYIIITEALGGDPAALVEMDVTVPTTDRDLPAVTDRVPTSSLLRLVGVTAGYGADAAVEGVSLDVDEHAFVGIVGPSGAGKTTILRLLAGSLAPSLGRVEQREGCSIGYVSQTQSIDWTFPITVQECVLLARTARRWRPWPDAADRRDAAQLLDRLGIGGLARRHIRDLSGGQQQRVFLARALLQRPDVVLLDEPTSGVDLRTRHDVLHLLGELHREGLAIVLTTHDLNGVAAHLPTIACLNRTLLAVGPPAQVLTPAVLEATYDAPLHVLDHAGIPVVVDDPHGRTLRVVEDAS